MAALEETRNGSAPGQGGRSVLSRHRWWLALVGLVFTPWIGPHLDTYIPLGWVLMNAARESPDPGFWLLAAVFVAIGYAVWFFLLALAAALGSWLRRDR